MNDESNLIRIDESNLIENDESNLITLSTITYPSVGQGILLELYVCLEHFLAGGFSLLYFVRFGKLNK